MNTGDVICRLCLKSTPITSCTDIFTTADLHEKIFIFSSLKVLKNDGLPPNICQMCNSKLIDSLTFRELCIISDKLQRNAIKQQYSQKLDSSSFATIKLLGRNEKEEPEDTKPTFVTDTQALDSLIRNDGENNQQWLQIYQRNTKNTIDCIEKQQIVPRSSNDALVTPVKTCHWEVDDKIKLETEEIDVSWESKIGVDSIKKPKTRKTEKEAVNVSDAEGNVPKKKLSNRNENGYTCKFCEKVYPSVGGWRYHMHTMHSQTFQPFICDLCGKSFKAKKNLERHKNSLHFHMKLNLCELCGRGFSSKYGLKVHKIWHTGERNYHCETCDFKFRTKSKLNAHKAVHGGPKNFMCEVCSRDFRWKKDFEIHLRTHTGEKPYGCLVCGKFFATVNNKKKHERSHGQAAAKLQQSQHVDGLAFVTLDVVPNV